jgi:rRNA-processing protein FCF1
MQIFHVIVDTNVLRPAHFGSSLFDKLLRRVDQGVMKLYIPEVVLEERRTQLLFEYNELAEQARGALLKMARSPLDILLQGIHVPTSMDLPTRDEVDRNSRAVFRKYLEDKKVEVLPFTYDHARQAFERYMHGKPPFLPAKERETERKHIPDSWIFEAALEIKARPGRHCVLVKDQRFKAALQEAGFEIFSEIGSLDLAIEEATAVVPIRPAGGEVGAEAIAAADERVPQPSELERLRAEAFRDLDVIVLGMNEALKNPEKEKLFAILAGLDVDRGKAELMASTLVASEVLREIGNRLLPTDVKLAERMATEPIVRELLMKLI